MGFWRAVTAPLRNWRAKSQTTYDLLKEMVRYGYAAKSGVNVNLTTALQVTTVLRCAAVIADGVASVPLKIFQKDEKGGRNELVAHPLSDIFENEPNEWQDGLEYREMLGLHAALTGGAFSYINRIRESVAELIPFEPGFVSTERAPDGTISYVVTPQSGEAKRFARQDIWHIRGPSWDSIIGIDMIRMAREAIGLAVVTESAHALLHRNGLQTSGIYSVTGTLNAQQHTGLTTWIENHILDESKRFKPLVLDRDAKWLQQTMTGVDAEHLATRRFQIEEICRGLGVNPIMVGYSDKNSTYASVEQMFLAHFVHTVRPWHRRFEASIRKNLLRKDERLSGIYPKFIDGEFLRGSAEQRAEYYSKALGSGGSPPWLTQNEVRAFEELPPRPESWANELPRGTNPSGTDPNAPKRLNGQGAADLPKGNESHGQA